MSAGAKTLKTLASRARSLRASPQELKLSKAEALKTLALRASPQERKLSKLG
jgi:hypothetical protein